MLLRTRKDAYIVLFPGGLSEVEVKLCLNDDCPGHLLQHLVAGLGGKEERVLLLLLHVL